MINVGVTKHSALINAAEFAALINAVRPFLMRAAISWGEGHRKGGARVRVSRSAH